MEGTARRDVPQDGASLFLDGGSLKNLPAGDWKARAGGRRSAPSLPQTARRGIFVEPKTKIYFSPVGAASSVRIPDDVATDGALSVCGRRCCKYVSPDGLQKNPCFF
jgi:hypothetical protein